MIGIYKITNPKRKIYIGQSVNLEKRLNNYKKLKDCSNQSKLYSSLLKYGVLEHAFEVLEECTVGELNTRERYWQDFYNVLEEGLNLKLTKTEDKSGYCSQETAEKIGNANRGNKKPLRTEEHRKNLSKALKGKNISETTRQKLREIRVGKINEGMWKGANNPSARSVIDRKTGQIFPTVKEAATSINVRPNTLYAWLSGTNTNKSSMCFYK